MMEAIPPLVALTIIFVALPWIIFHYITRWKTAATLTSADEAMLEELHDLARRLDDRVCTVERILTAEEPNWRSIGCDPAPAAIEHSANLRRIK